MSNYLKSKADALKIFKEQCNNFPLWTLFELGKKNPIFTNVGEGDESKTIKMFESALVDLYPEKIYTVKMFRNLLHRKGGQKFISHNFEFSFQFDRDGHSIAPVMNGVSGAVPGAAAVPSAAPVVNPYSVDLRQQISLNDHVSLIAAKAKAESDNQYYLSVIADKTKMIVDLERTVAELEEEVEELENELDAMEDESQEEEKAQIAGEQATSMESAIASVIKENGGVLLENLLNKGVKGAPEFRADNISGDEQGQVDNKTVNGIPGVHLMDLNLVQLNDEMLKINPRWKQHLCKLILIGQQKPATFKVFVSQLENF